MSLYTRASNYQYNRISHIIYRIFKYGTNQMVSQNSCGGDMISSREINFKRFSVFWLVKNDFHQTESTV